MAVAAAKEECFSGRAAKRHADACSQHKIFQTQKTIMIHWVGERAKTSCGGASCCRSLHVVEIGAYKLPKPTKSLPHDFFPTLAIVPSAPSTFFARDKSRQAHKAVKIKNESGLLYEWRDDSRSARSTKHDEKCFVRPCAPCSLRCRKGQKQTGAQSKNSIGANSWTRVLV